MDCCSVSPRCSLSCRASPLRRNDHDGARPRLQPARRRALRVPPRPSRPCSAVVPTNSTRHSPGDSVVESCSTAYGMGETLVATVVAFGVGLAVIAGLMRYISRHSFMPFVIYRILLGVVLLILLGTGVIAA